ncbi:2-oxoglutarate dehydrogenase E2 component (dihydrolipoamide succinyltransferase) [Mesonia hippocampi]|uniref:Dihydrolipoamide acetyltransferase component of pyruvate dehydrogenase complex n=1 Tax=Mesonia hippocampi TaxID=1628250 RepID=A0A840EY29_9FLAO|nr:dihydrolipoamide acetyltransferase family protein [Mesonia hippocampi]MBB4119737.1 2-oxoglutarate dehydrogenase E2 component (dihydrolipoamide succinyltransferase) [Mesonia hippocampi]
MSIIEVTLPKMGESISEATVINWMVKEGDFVEQDQTLLEVATDKVDSEVPAPSTGVITEILVQANEVVQVGSLIAKIEASQAEVGAAKPPKKAKPKTPNETPKPKLPKQPKKLKTASSDAATYTVPKNTNAFYSPLVEKIAKEYHISYEELRRIPVSGSNGRLRKSDIFNYIEAGRPAQFAQSIEQDANHFQVPDLKFDKGKGSIVAMDRMRQLIADHMVFSKHTSPHVTAYVEADLTEMVIWRNANKEAFFKKHNQKLTFTPLFIEAVTKAIKDFPMINSSLDGKNIIVKDDINIGMATALPSGNLIVPVVKNADTKNLAQLAENVNELALKARDNKLKHEDTSGSTFTISNVGTFGSLMGTPIINQPEVAILATGIIKKRAEVIEYPEGDKIEIRQMMYLSLSFDHRVVDGFLAGSFLRRIADNLENFEKPTF